MTQTGGVVNARIRSRRIELGMTQEKLAQAACVAVRTVARIESGEGSVSLDVLVRLASALGSTVGELVDPPVARPRR